MATPALRLKSKTFTAKAVSVLLIFMLNSERLNMKTIVITLFILTYVIMLILPKYRQYAAAAVAVVMVILGVVSPLEAVNAIDWNVIMMPLCLWWRRSPWQ